ncbi:MAG: alpha/beta hydrolase [Gammaproteobacteria bacterium]|nr:alpha/beta hydrolase [Gammaproteobacteria bacterium]MBU1442512.1 alpha/beta hydrolase [Gammaproteobacteria bacterium]MBU2287516.1 alpha/beta hydrolase [Gammaproteobacteria bacterium]MBU2409289.1 alpha/beta hydrolase [Gammaproteobacteria bacterium]
MRGPEGPSELRALLAELGPRWGSDLPGHSQRVKDAYAPLLAAAPKSGTEVVRDIAYGEHARQVLDIFRPVHARQAPVVAFVHGGAFVRGDKRASAEIYDNVLHWFARQGFVGVNIEYRLAPEARHPEGARDVAQAMAWLGDHVAEFGGDPARMLLIGHSAGGTHVATYAFDPALGPGVCKARAIVLVSARLRADQSPENPNARGVAAYFGDDATAYERLSPMAHAAGSEVPVFIVTAEFENPLLDVYGFDFAQRLAAARGNAPRFLQMRGHNHMSIVAHFNSAEESLGREILDFFAALPEQGER